MEVHEHNAMYIKGVLDERAVLGNHPVLHFEDIEGRGYLINSAFLTRVIFVALTPPDNSVNSGNNEDSLAECESANNGTYALRVYLAHSGRPFSSFELSYDDINRIFTHPNLHDWTSAPMIAFRDEDDDLNFINPLHVVMMEWHNLDTVSGFIESEMADEFYESKMG
jgi:hypothetical protein